MDALFGPRTNGGPPESSWGDGIAMFLQRRRLPIAPRPAGRNFERSVPVQLLRHSRIAPDRPRELRALLERRPGTPLGGEEIRSPCPFLPRLRPDSRTPPSSAFGAGPPPFAHRHPCC